MPAKFVLVAALLALLALDVNGQRGGGGGGGRGGARESGDDDVGCCYAHSPTLKCDTDSKSKCERKGCEWRSGDDADCAAPTPEPGCCYGADVQCYTAADESTCDRMANRKGCEWRSGNREDLCAITTTSEEPGCCAAGDQSNGSADDCIEIATQSQCERKNRRWGCEWRTGSDAMCGPTTTTTTTQDPGCCRGDSAQSNPTCNEYDSREECEQSQHCYFVFGGNVEEDCTVPTMTQEPTSIIVCEDGGDIDCAVVHCHFGGACSVTCDEYGCERAVINCPADETCSVLCDGYRACYDATIHCPTDNACAVTCTGDACIYSDITWPTTPGLGSLECDGNWACTSVDFPDPDPTAPLNLDCSEWAQCAYATIRCPAEAECSVTCGEMGCLGSELHCPQDSSCSVSCVGDNACQDMEVEWPSNPELGGLMCSGSNACTGVNLPSDQQTMLFGGNVEQSLVMDTQVSLSTILLFAVVLLCVQQLYKWWAANRNGYTKLAA